MQGRLSSPERNKIQSFPKTAWREEFSKAHLAGLGHIEWIFEEDEWEKNPISHEEGLEEIQELIRTTGTEIISVCADYFMDLPYFSVSDNKRKEHSEKLIWLIHQAAEIGAKYIDIPFVDASRIPSQDEFPLVMEFLQSSLPYAERKNITLALETSLAPDEFITLLRLLNNQYVQANYDTGNSSGIGYDCVEELETYGKWIKTVHIKDRLLNGSTVPLGTGSARFDLFFPELAKLRFAGPIILQAAREQDDEVTTAIKNRLFVDSYLDKIN